MFKVNNRNTRTRCETCSGVVLLPLLMAWNIFKNFFLTSYLLLKLNIFTACSSVSIVNFEQVNFGWVISSQNV